MRSTSAAAPAASPSCSPQSGATVVGIDLSPGLIETAKERAAERGLTIDYRAGDCEHLEGIEDAAFDAVGSSVGIMFSPDHEASARELARVTKPGGRIALANWQPGPGVQDLFKLMAPFQPAPPPSSPFDWGDEAKVTRAARRRLRPLVRDAYEHRELRVGRGLLAAHRRRTTARRRSLYESLGDRGEEMRRDGSSSSATRARIARPAVPARHRGSPLNSLAAGVDRRGRRRSCSELIRLDTTNPPGNETLAAELLRDYLEAAGVECRAVRAGARAREPRRAHPGPRRRRRRSRCSRTPTSCSRIAREWQRDPFGGELVGDEVWGRGALDMKGEVAASAPSRSRRSRARDGAATGDLIFVAAADEEVGDGFGLQWLVEEHPDAVRADFSVNEGAGDRVELGGKVLYLCATAEKMSSPFMLRVHGPQRSRVDAEHRRQRARQGGAARRAARRVRGRAAADPGGGGFLRGAARRGAAARRRRSRAARAVAPLAGELIEPLLGMTVAPTMAHASDKRNVIPALCEITVDTRLLPGSDAGGGRGDDPRVARRAATTSS